MKPVEAYEMNGPCEFTMSVWIVNMETEQVGKVTLQLSLFKYPTPVAIAERMKKFELEEMPTQFPGCVLATKKQAWSAMVMERTGQPSQLICHDEWDPIPE